MYDGNIIRRWMEVGQEGSGWVLLESSVHRNVSAAIRTHEKTDMWPVKWTIEKPYSF